MNSLFSFLKEIYFFLVDCVINGRIKMWPKLSKNELNPTFQKYRLKPMKATAVNVGKKKLSKLSFVRLSERNQFLFLLAAPFKRRRHTLTETRTAVITAKQSPLCRPSNDCSSRSSATMELRAKIRNFSPVVASKWLMTVDGMITDWVFFVCALVEQGGG